ncbi:MAG: DUF3027 domain-containing protein [Micropruina sp.]|nr:DUF3027 domain-containing protein [Micropruina sp.]
MAPTDTLDAACAAAIDLARDAALGSSEVMAVGDHRGVVASDVRVATHFFDCPHPGYPGWQWSVTVVRASRAKTVTVNEVTLLPSEGALLAPRWVPWGERIAAGDVAPGVLMPTPDNDPRVEPGFTGGEAAADADPAEWAQTRVLVAELGLGRERVLSSYGRDEAVERWIAGEGGPDNPMTAQAPANCETCAYFVPLSGNLARVFGVCANEYSQTDGGVVSRDHGCGAHSDAVEATRAEEPARPVWDTLFEAGQLFA